MRTASAALVLLAASTYGLDARADDRVAAAQALFEEARSLMARGEHAAACSKFEGSQQLDPGPGTQYNLALCYEKSGRTASAWATYLEAATAYKATNRSEWEARARDRARALEGTLSRLTIVLAPGAPSNVRVTRDGTSVIPAALGVAIPIDPGAHVIAATTGGKEPAFTTSVDLAPGAKRTVEIPRFWSGSSGAATTAGTGSSPPEPATRSGQKTLGLVLGGAGIVGLGVGSVSGLFAIRENSASEKECPTDGVCRSAAALDANEAASKWATVSTVSFVAAGVLLAAGAVLYLAVPKSTKVGLASARELRIAW